MTCNGGIIMDDKKDDKKKAIIIQVEKDEAKYDTAVGFLKGHRYEVVQTRFEPGLRSLAKVFNALADVDAVFFVQGWKESTDANIVRDAAVAYNLQIIE
jgi:hypothetical protein